MNDQVPTSVAWDVKSYGYEVAVLDQHGQIIGDTYSSEWPGADLNEIIKYARQTANETAEENGIPLGVGRVFRDHELMLTVEEIREIP